MKKKILFLVLVFIASKNFSQENKNNNPIIYIEGTLGGFTYKTSASVFLSGSLNYQYKKNVFSVKRTHLENAPLTIDINDNRPTEHYVARETSILFGRRYIRKKISYSFSIGLSRSTTIKQKKINQNLKNITFYGIPIEFNFKEFKSKKRRSRILGIIPYGQPTGFGGAIGVKLFGNISQQSYIGLGLNYGFGYYKKY